MLKKIHIFKAGNYGETSSRKWNNDEVKQLVNNYDFNFRRAMVKLGHDGIFDSEKPAVGWVKSLEYTTDDKDVGNVYAIVEFNDNEIDNIKDKYINVSIEAVKNIEEYDQNTDKRGAYLLGVALLGSSQPAVPSLEPVTFSSEKNTEGFKNVVSFENTFFKTIKKDDTIPLKDGKGADEMEKLQEYQKKVSELESKLQEFQAKERRAKVESFVSGYSKKVIPAVKDELVEFCLNLDDTQLEAFQKIMDKMPEVAIFDEKAGGEEPQPDTKKTINAVDEALKDLEIYKKMNKGV